MTTFPALAPNQISYDLGRLNIGEEQTFGGPIRFRHSLQVNGHQISLVFNGIDQTTIETLRQHYEDNDGTHRYFAVPEIVWGNYAAVASDSLYRYLEPPTEEHQGLYYNIKIALRVVVGTNLLYILYGGGAAQPALAIFSSLAFNGYAPFILNGGAADPLNPEATLVLQGGGASQ